MATPTPTNGKGKTSPRKRKSKLKPRRVAKSSPAAPKKEVATAEDIIEQLRSRFTDVRPAVVDDAFFKADVEEAPFWDSLRTDGKPSLRLVKITPEDAEIALQPVIDGLSPEKGVSGCLGKQRNLLPAKARVISREVLRGLWCVATPLAFDTNGHLLNGLHRLAGILMSGISVYALVLYNVDPKTFDTCDSMSSTSRTDLVRLEGYDYHAGQIANALGNLLSFIYYDEDLTRTVENVSTSEIIYLLRQVQDPDAVYTFTDAVQDIYGKKGGKAPLMGLKNSLGDGLITLRFLMGLKDDAEAVEFFNALENGGPYVEGCRTVLDVHHLKLSQARRDEVTGAADLSPKERRAARSRGLRKLRKFHRKLGWAVMGANAYLEKFPRQNYDLKGDEFPKVKGLGKVFSKVTKASVESLGNLNPLRTDQVLSYRRPTHEEVSRIFLADVTIDRKLAEDFLKLEHPRLRKRKSNRVGKIAKAMTKGEFAPHNGQPLILTEDLRLLDGSQRLRGLITADKKREKYCAAHGLLYEPLTVTFQVLVGIDKKAAPFIDQTYARTDVQILRISQRAYPRILGPVLKIIQEYKLGRDVQKFGMSQTEMGELLEKHPQLEKTIYKFVADQDKGRFYKEPVVRMLGRNNLIVFRWRTAEIYGKDPKINAFLKNLFALCNGAAAPDPGAPEAVLHEQLVAFQQEAKDKDNRVASREVFARLILAWNDFYLGEDPIEPYEEKVTLARKLPMFVGDGEYRAEGTQIFAEMWKPLNRGH